MILVTGTAGSGKSTTQACIIDRINNTKEAHIITLEDPIEYLHSHKKSIVSQREISIDTEDYLSALRACLRQAPDVILMGEIRDPETIRTAMTAAETGHLVIATLHTKGAVNTIDRILDSFPSTQQGQIRVQLSMVLHTVVSQQLLPDVNGELIKVYVTHFGLAKAEQRNAVSTVVDLMKNESNPSFFMGDLNMQPDNEILAPIFDLLTDSADKIVGDTLTFASFDPKIKIDYIFSKKDVKFITAAPLDEMASDHRPYMVTAEI